MIERLCPECGRPQRVGSRHKNFCQCETFKNKGVGYVGQSGTLGGLRTASRSGKRTSDSVSDANNTARKLRPKGK